MSALTALSPGPSSTTCSTPAVGRSNRRLGKRGVRIGHGSSVPGAVGGLPTTTATRPRPVGPSARPSGPRAPSASWVAPPITSRSPEPGARSRDGPPDFAFDEERAARAEREDRDDRVVEPAQLAVAVRRDAVTTVAVVVEPGPAESARRSAPRASPLASTSTGCRRGRTGGRSTVSRGSSTMRSYIQRRPCCHSIALDQLDEERVATVQPAGREVDPRTVVEPRARDGGGGIQGRRSRCRAGRSGAAPSPEDSEHLFVSSSPGIHRSASKLFHATGCGS